VLQALFLAAKQTETSVCRKNPSADLSVEKGKKGMSNGQFKAGHGSRIDSIIFGILKKEIETRKDIQSR
jgi:hypothetical protein